jgi:hypothetical protein
VDAVQGRFRDLGTVATKVSPQSSNEVAKPFRVPTKSARCSPDTKELRHRPLELQCVVFLADANQRVA